MIIPDEKDTAIFWMRKLIQEFAREFIIETNSQSLFMGKNKIKIKNRGDETVNDPNYIAIYDDYITTARILSNPQATSIAEVKDFTIDVVFSDDSKSNDMNELARKFTATLKREFNGTSPTNYHFFQMVATTDDRLMEYDLDERAKYSITFRVFFRKENESVPTPQKKER